MNINRILVPTDFSASARQATEYAVAFAKRCSAAVHLLHVPVLPSYLLADFSYNPGPEAVARIMSDAQQALDDLAQMAAHAEIEHSTEIRNGTVHEIIHEYAQEQQIDLIVLGTHGRSGVSKLMYGSVTERVVRTAHAPIIVVPPKGGVVPNSIIVAYDFSAPAKRAVEVARAVCDVFEGTLHLVHSYLDVWGEYSDRGMASGETAEKRRKALRLGLEEMLAREVEDLFPDDAERVRTHLVTGDPTDGVLTTAKEVGADLICAGVTGKSRIERVLLGSVARRLLNSGELPLLLTHTDA